MQTQTHMTTLRPYQKDVLDRLLASDTSGIVVAPTGSGKSVIIDALVRAYNNDAVVIVNELTVKGQLGDRLPDDIPIISPLSFDPTHPPRLIVIDEVHHYRRDRAWGRVFSVLGDRPNADVRIVGFTATPVWDASLSLPLLVRIPYAVLREQGFLAPPLTAVLAQSDDEVEDALATSLCHHTVFYISSREQHRPQFGRLITADTPAEQRHFLPSDNGRICNIATLTTGWDDPDIDSIVLCRRIGSDNPQTYLQILGRLRRGGVVIDRADNVLRFGLDEDALSETLGRRGAPTPSLAPALKRCLGCQRLLHPRQNVCPYCGYACPPPHRSGHLWEPLPIEAWLRLLAPSRLAPLRWKVCPYTNKGLWPIKLPVANITAWVGRGDGVERWGFVHRLLEEGVKKGASFWCVKGSSWLLCVQGESSEGATTTAGQVVWARDVSLGEEGVWVVVARA